MTDILASIDLAVDGLCPCGSDPRPGSAYCSEDCVPNYQAAHTSSDTDGTRMRWRPDLVTEADDSDLRDLGSNTFYEGRFHAQLFQRGESIDGAVTWHLRLDDGHRFVGVDLHDVRSVDGELEQRVADKWAALERDLTNGQQIEVGLPWDVMLRNDWQDALGRYLRAELSRSASIGGMVTPTPATLWSSPDSDPIADMRRVMDLQREAMCRAGDAVRRTGVALASMAQSFDSFNQSVSRMVSGSARRPQPQHPMLAAIEARRNRNTGPERRSRPPRQISPRH